MKILHPPGWPRPRGYANGVAAEGRLVFVAGQIGWDANGTIASDDLVEQLAAEYPDAALELMRSDAA